MANRIQLRRGTAAEWASIDPVLAQGEPGIETDTGKQKFGNGTDPWSARPYASEGPQGIPGPPATDASQLTAGTVADARLPSRLQDTALSATFASKGVETSKLDKTEAATTYATLTVVQRPQRFYAGHYNTLAACFAARDATTSPAIIELEPKATYQAANLRIDKTHTSVKGNKAAITLPPGADQDVLRVGPDATFLDLEQFDLVGNYATQTGTSRGLVFEDYIGADFRYSDRTYVERVNIDGFKDKGAVIGLKRLHVIFDKTFIRDFGSIGLEMNSSDCRFLNGGLGGIRGQYGIKLNAGSNWVQSSGIWSNSVAGVWLTEKANGVKILNNDLDNNLGGGLRAVGLASDSLDASIIGNHFRGNSTAGDGLHSDAYFEQVSNISLIGNRFYSQLGSTARTKYNVDAGPGVQSLNDPGSNPTQTSYPTIATWSPTALAARSNRARSLDLVLDGSGDVVISRQGSGAQVSNDWTAAGTSLGQRFSATGTAGAGFYQGLKQTVTPGTPSASAVREFYRDNGSGKIQKCAVFPSGVVQVLWTEA